MDSGEFMLLGGFMPFIWITLSAASLVIFVCKAKFFPGGCFISSLAALAFSVSGARTAVQSAVFALVLLIAYTARLTAFICRRITESGIKSAEEYSREQQSRDAELQRTNIIEF